MLMDNNYITCYCS